MIRPALLAVLALAAPATVHCAAGEALIDVGKPFPLVKLPLVGAQGGFDSLESYRGRKLMLHLFASW